MIETLIIYTVLVCPKGHPKETWTEELKCTGDETPFDIILEYNRTLKPHDNPRALVKIISETQPMIEHVWRKTNNITIQKGGRLFDTYQCMHCNITAKRFGLSGHHVRDAKFRHPKFQYCKPK